jgi:hypothetical protein
VVSRLIDRRDNAIPAACARASTDAILVNGQR